MLHKFKSEISQSMEQKAGNNATQVQANSITIYQGISEERARAICDEKIEAALATYSNEAQVMGRQRVEKFNSNLIRELSQIKEGLASLADPSMQMHILEAQKCAVTTERSTDYKLLTDLLVYRVSSKGNRYERSAIRKAIEIVGDISDEALVAMTVYHAMVNLSSTSSGVEAYLERYDNLLAQIMTSPLPENQSWISHLEILGAVQYVHFARNNSFCDIIKKHLGGYVSAGIRKESEEHSKANDILAKNGLPPSMLLVDHPLLENRVCVNLSSIMAVDSLCYNSVNGRVELKPHQREAVRCVYNLYENNVEMEHQALTILENECNSFEYLRRFKEWFSKHLPSNGMLILTPVGQAIAHANLHQYNSNVSQYEFRSTV